MNRSLSTLRRTCLLLTVAALGSAFFWPQASHQYQVAYESQIRLLGSTNINQFTCAASECRGNARVEVGELNQGSFRLTHPTLKVLVPQLDCGNRIMNSDLRETLRADEFPYIRVKVAAVDLPQSGTLTNPRICLSGWATATIFIAEARKTVRIPIQATNLGHNRFQFSGTTPLRMTHFGLEPPTAMLGMVEVDDELKVEVSLEVTLLGGALQNSR